MRAVIFVLAAMLCGAFASSLISQLLRGLGLTNLTRSEVLASLSSKQLTKINFRGPEIRFLFAPQNLLDTNLTSSQLYKPVVFRLSRTSNAKTETSWVRIQSFLLGSHATSLSLIMRWTKHLASLDPGEDSHILPMFHLQD
jgi:hypothetical protein